MSVLLDIIVFWCLASLFLGCLWALIGWRTKGAPRVGEYEYFADYSDSDSDLSPEELAAYDPEIDALLARSRVVKRTSFDWPGHSFRIIDLPETKYERAEAIQKAARNVG